MGRPGWLRRHGAAVERRRVAGGRGWAGDVNDDIEGTQAYVLILTFAGHGTGHFESCDA